MQQSTSARACDRIRQMSYRFVTRWALQEQLAAVDADPSAAAALRAWVRDVIIGDDVEVDTQSQPLILAAVQRLDLASVSDTDLVEAARQLHALLVNVQDEDLARVLIPLARDRSTLVDVLRKAMNGKVSHTGWLSFIAEQHWPSPVKKALAAVHGPGQTQLLDGLLKSNYKTVATVLGLDR